MTATRNISATGLQIAFFIFAVALLAAPLSKWIVGAGRWAPEVAAMIEKAIPFVMAIVILAVFPRLRRLCSIELNNTFDPRHRAEVAAVAALHLAMPFAWAGAVALWYWIAGGEAAVAHLMRQLKTHDAEMAHAFLPAEMVRSLLVAGMLAPLTEELVFRGMLYRAWEARWGWLASMLATSAVFAAYHPNWVPTFIAGVLYVCLYRRTGSIWAPIMVHSAFNVLIWYPILGRFIFPRTLEAPGDLQSWGFHVAALLVVLVAVPAYVSLARYRPEPADPFPPTVHGPLPR